MDTVWLFGVVQIRSGVCFSTHPSDDWIEDCTYAKEETATPDVTNTRMIAKAALKSAQHLLASQADVFDEAFF